MLLERGVAAVEENRENYEGMTLEELEGLLSKQQRRFVEEYEKDGNGTQAAIRAGYAPGKDNATAAVQASRLLRSAKVSAYRRARARELCRQAGISRETLSLDMLEVYRRCMSAEPVMVWDREQGRWTPSGEWQFDSKGALKALELLGDSLGMFTQKVEQTGNTTVHVELGPGLEELAK